MSHRSMKSMRSSYLLLNGVFVRKLQSEQFIVGMD